MRRFHQSDLMYAAQLTATSLKFECAVRFRRSPKNGVLHRKAYLLHWFYSSFHQIYDGKAHEFRHVD